MTFRGAMPPAQQAFGQQMQEQQEQQQQGGIGGGGGGQQYMAQAGYYGNESVDAPAHHHQQFYQQMPGQVQVQNHGRQQQQPQPQQQPQQQYYHSELPPPQQQQQHRQLPPHQQYGGMSSTTTVASGGLDHFQTFEGFGGRPLPETAITQQYGSIWVPPQQSQQERQERQVAMHHHHHQQQQQQQMMQSQFAQHQMYHAQQQQRHAPSPSRHQQHFQSPAQQHGHVPPSPQAQQPQQQQQHQFQLQSPQMQPSQVLSPQMRAQAVPVPRQQQQQPKPKPKKQRLQSLSQGTPQQQQQFHRAQGQQQHVPSPVQQTMQPPQSPAQHNRSPLPRPSPSPATRPTKRQNMSTSTSMQPTEQFIHNIAPPPIQQHVQPSQIQHYQQEPIQQEPIQQEPVQQPQQQQQQQQQLQPPPPPAPPQPPFQVEQRPPTPPQLFQPPQEQMHFVNLQDIQTIPPPKPIVMGNGQSTGLTQTQPLQEPFVPQPTQQSPASVTQPSLDHATASHTPQVQQQQQKMGPPRVKSSPHSSVTNSPALTARSPSISKKSPAIPPKQRPIDTVPLMVSVAEECFDKARAGVHDVAMFPDEARVDEYQRLISTGLACLEAALASNRLAPRQEAKIRIRYAAVMLEETDNLMEAETALTKGITLCDKHRLLDLKYSSQYAMINVLFQRSHKAALNAVDRHIADVETYKHIHWCYTFRLLKAKFYVECGQTADANALDNLRAIRTLANHRGDNALSVFTSLLEGLALLKTAREGNMEKVQSCIAQAAKFQFDTSVQVLQLDVLLLLLDLASSLNRQSPEVTSQKLLTLQQRLDNGGDWGNVKADFLIPIKKQTQSAAQIVSEDTAPIIRMGERDSQVDYLVVTFMTKMEITSLVFTLSGLTNVHKSNFQGRRSAGFWREGLRILDEWDKSTAGIPYGPSVSLKEAMKQRAWRTEAQAYLSILLGLYSASHCQWVAVKQFVIKLESLISPSNPSLLRVLAIYLSGVYRQGTGDLINAIAIFRHPEFNLVQSGPGARTVQHEISLLAALNRLWIMQHPAHYNDQETLDLIEQLHPLCTGHPNVDLRTAWHNVMAAVATDPPQMLNQQKQHIQAAMGGSKSTNNIMGAAITLAIMRSRLFENVIGEQALKSALAASKQAHRSGNVLWQSVADGMLAQSYEVQGQNQEAQKELQRAIMEAREAFPSSDSQ